MSRYRKGIAAAAGGVLQVVTTATVPDSWAPWVQLLGAVATVVIVVLAPANDATPPPARHIGGQLGG